MLYGINLSLLYVEFFMVELKAFRSNLVITLFTINRNHLKGSNSSTETPGKILDYQAWEVISHFCESDPGCSRITVE